MDAVPDSTRFVAELGVRVQSLQSSQGQGEPMEAIHVVLSAWWLTAHGAAKRKSTRGSNPGDQCSRCCGKETSGSDAEEEDWELHRQKTGPKLKSCKAVPTSPLS
eukprot:s1874_g1.t1